MKPIPLLLLLVLLAASAIVVRRQFRTDAQFVGSRPVATGTDRENADPGTQASAELAPVDDEKPKTIADVMEIARQGHQHMSENLHDYVCRFVKQDRDPKGVLKEQSEAVMKVQTKFRNGDDQAPKRVYLGFVSPPSQKGREVIWAADLYDGKMCVHEGGLLGFKRLYLDPLGFLATQNERNPITEAGMVHLLESLMERGERLMDNPNITIDSTDDHLVGDLKTQLIQIHCSQPAGGEDDFSFAEFAIDRERWLMVTYRSFGFPENEGDEPPLIESYQYLDVETNVGLTEKDFDPDNPEYNFPAF